MNLKRWSIISFFLITLIIGGVVFYTYERKVASLQPIVPSSSLPEPQPFSIPQDTSSNEPPKEIPDKFLLQVPFTVQAPTANWDEMHNEACEEASAIMVAAYFSGDTRKVLPASEVEKQISNLTQWQEKEFGYSLDSTAAETAEMIRAVYSLKAELVSNFSEKDIREALLAKKVVILALSGQKLGNPYFKQPGPIYHMIVVRGYTQKELITNDPGTKRGENYPYTFETLKKAGADWNHSTNTIDVGKSVMIVVSK